MSASFSPLLHQGIPLILRDNLYYKVASLIAEHGGFEADVTGVLRRPPKELLKKLAFGQGITWHSFLDVQKLEIKSPCCNKLSTTTAAAVSYVVNAKNYDTEHSYKKKQSPSHIG
ncbi:MAG: hypothetical protein GPJ21_23040 [Microcystis aeruginosa W13-11]|nr:hypothetical protein [Microcystis aeruginosa W13-11]